MSLTPVESLRNSTLRHVLPPSVVLYTPRSALGAHTWPNAPTYATSGLCGSTMTRAICLVSVRPTDVHVLPSSVVFHTPSPCDTLPRLSNSPAPPYTASGLD